MTEPEAIQLVESSPYLEGDERGQWIIDAAAELRRLYAVIEQALEALLNFPGDISDEMFESIVSLKAALAEPVCCCGEQTAPGVVHRMDGPCYMAEPEQEPVAWMLGDKFYKAKQCRFFSKNPGEEIPGQIPLYTAPPQRKPLSDDEIQAIWKKTFESGASPNTFARAIEAAHGIKEPT